MNTQKLSKEDKQKIKFKEVKTTNGKLVRNASETAAFYLKKIPEYSVLSHQIEQFEIELNIYKANKDSVLESKTAVMIKSLKAMQKQMSKIVRGKDITDADKDKTRAKKIVKSDKLIQLEEKRTNLAQKLNDLSPSYWMKRLKDAELLLDDTKNHLNYDEELFDVDEFFNTNKEQNIKSSEDKIKELEAERNNIYASISKIVKIPTSQLITLSKYEIKQALNEALRQDYEACKDEIDSTNMAMAIEKDALRDENSVKLTDLVFSVLETESPDNDLANPDSPKGKQAREMMAVANIPLVNAIANFNCRKYNLLNLFDDAVSAGLLGLTQAINVWYSKQVLISQPLPFKTFASSYITNQIKEELASLGRTGGQISGSSYADKVHYQSKRVSNFVKANADLFSDIDEEQVKIIVEGLQDDELRAINSSTNQSDIEGTVTGDEEESADVWANIAIDDNYGADDIIEMKAQYKKMMKNVITILSLMTNKTLANGEIVQTDKPLFDVYDRRIFLLNFGLYKNIFNDAVENKKNINEYTQEEIAQHITQMKKQRGEMKADAKPITQEAIAIRIKNITNKLDEVFKIYPELRGGFEYFFRRKAELSVISREIEKQQINHFAEKVQKQSERLQKEEMLNISIANGDTVSDILDNMDNFDDKEIYQLFDEMLNLSNQ